MSWTVLLQQSKPSWPCTAGLEEMGTWTVGVALFKRLGSLVSRLGSNAYHLHFAFP
jgi:hypothetical protein